ncbi:MAG: RNA-binding protein [Pseudolabrys sp.]|nr:RNA-binding protein [Pseudolabrys sp.]MBV9954410.1 RNA-binding protein [Pseudolabrys sp.]
MLAVATDDGIDGGTASVRRSRERACALTRVVRPIDELIRFVADPNGQPVADLKQNLPGRGLWLTATRETVNEAVKRNIFARGFKREMRAPASLADDTQALLERAALDALAIAAKGGNVVAGHGKVEDALMSGKAIALLHAASAAADGKRKLAQSARRGMGTREIPVIEAFSSGQLDLALGRLNVIHAALLAGPVSHTFLSRTKRLQRFRSGFTDAASEILTPETETEPEK